MWMQMAAELGGSAPLLRSRFSGRHGPGSRPARRASSSAVTMPKRGKQLKFRAHDACSGQVTVADYANSDPAVVRSGRLKKTVANAVQQEVKSLCGLEAFQVPAEEALSGMGKPCDILDSSDEMDAQEESTQERSVSRKKEKQETQRRPGWRWRRRVFYGYLAAAGFLYPS